MVKGNFFDASSLHVPEVSQLRKQAVLDAGLMDIEDEVAMETLHELEIIFNYVDLDNEGSISANELGHVLDILGMKYDRNEMTYMMNKLDIDHNGEVDFVEFVAFMTTTATTPYSQEEVLRAFKLFEDKEYPGFISKSNLIDLLCIYSEKAENRCKLEEAKDLVGQMETNSKGLIEYIPFVESMMN